MKYILILVLVCWGVFAHALGIGVATTSITSGRITPSFAWSHNFANLLVSGFSTGVKTPLYYHSAWSANLYTEFMSDKMGQLETKAWLGIGFFVAQRGLRSSPSAEIDKSQDFTGGPALRVDVTTLGHFNLWVESIFGMEKAETMILLSAQDINCIGIGYSF